MGYRDDVGAALDEVAETAEAVADEQLKLAAAARVGAEDARQGAGWAETVSSGLPQRLLDSLSSGVNSLRSAASRLRSAMIVGLAADGQTRRQIGNALGISHQRVTALLSKRSG